jgi:uncharacterized membrane protein HdeD (DUF308 family)
MARSRSPAACARGQNTTRRCLPPGRPPGVITVDDRLRLIIEPIFTRGASPCFRLCPLPCYGGGFWRSLLESSLSRGHISLHITVGAFVILFAIYAFLAAGSDAARAFSSDRAGPVTGYLFLALLSFAAGLIALLWPGLTALVLTIWIAAWAFVTGIMEVILAFWQGQAAGERAMWALGGLVSIALGVVLALHPDVGALSLATVFGLFSIIAGVSALVLSARARRMGTLAGRLANSPA